MVKRSSIKTDRTDLSSLGTLTLSKEPADMTNGFIITYGGVEENCTFDAIFAERANEFKDLVQNILFD